MTADPRRRRRQTRLGALAAVVLVIVAAVSVLVGVSTLRSSQAGSAPETDTRVEVLFPSTPTVAIGVVDDQDRLASLVIGVVAPSGVGGSLVSVPVNVDTSIGFGETRTPLSSQPFTPGDVASAEALTLGLESILSITVQHAVIVGPDELLALVDGVAPFEVDLPAEAIDADGDDEPVADAGVATLEASAAVAVLTAIDIDGPAYGHHAIDAAMWSAFAAAVSSSPGSAEPVFDVDGRPVEPVNADAAIDVLLSGVVGHRDLAIDRNAATEADNEANADFVIVDRSDALLVFGEIAPGLVSKPNESLSFQIIARFTDDQVTSAGVDATTAGLVQDLIGELLFAQGNVVSVQTSPTPEGAGEITRLEVADATFIDAVRDVAPVLFGEVEVVEATRLIEGVDVVAVLGTGFLDRRAEIAAESASTSTTDATDSSPDEADTESGDETDTTSDTVAADE